MKVQRAQIPDTNRFTWMVLDDDYLPIKPVDDFLVYCENIERSPNTIKSYAHHLKLYWEYLTDADLDWTSANVLDKIADFVAWLRCPRDIVFFEEQEAIRRESTINAVLSAVASFYQYHERVGTVPESSMYSLQNLPRRRYKHFLHHITQRKPTLTRLVKLKEPKRSPETLAPDQVKQLVDACKRTRDKLLISLLYETGMRIGQALGLKHQDIQTWANAIRIVPREGNPNASRAKHIEPYTVHVSTELMALYRDYLIDELDEINSDYVFVNLWSGQIGQPMQYSSIAALFRRLTKKTGIQVHPHVLRHTHATELIRGGMDVAYVQKRLGHAQIQTTMRYTHLTDSDLKEAYREYAESRRE
jgi:site-specific recombinase XerD